MKVGHILKKDIKNVKGLKYPFKIIVNEKCKYPKEQIIENEIYIGYCTTFLNDLHSKNDQKQQSFSSNKNMNNLNRQGIKNKLSISLKKILLRTNTHKFEKSLNKKKNFPYLGESVSTPKQKSKIKLITSYKKISTSLFNENSIIKKKIKIKKLKTLNNESNNKRSLIISGRKKGVTPICDSRKINDNLKGQNIISPINKKKKLYLMPNLMKLRLQKKIKNMNHIIDKLNSPIFINIKTSMN